MSGCICIGCNSRKRKGKRRFKDLELITSDFHTCSGTGRAAQQDGSDGGGWKVNRLKQDKNGSDGGG